LVCGDGYAFRRDGECLLAMLADGLGHGPLAAECASAAIEAFQNSKQPEPAKIVHEIHVALRGTRGAAVSVARLDPVARQVHFSGVGNVLGVVSAPGRNKNFVAMPGIVGHHMAAVREFKYDWPVESLVLLYSDGIGSHWSLDEYEGLGPQDPSLISAVIYRDRKRGRDDASVITIRKRSSA
jgi:serine phosphatase RsbU (regulator of sigma subunit)